MPLAQQPSQQQHHHLFSAIGSFLHAFQPSSHHNAPNSKSSGTSSTFSRHGSSELSDLYQAFESHLTQRLSSLLPAEDSHSVSLASLKNLMDLLLETQADLRTFVPMNHKEIKAMEEFLERSVKLLDVCRSIKEQMLEMESLKGMLDLVSFSLNSEDGNLNKGQASRARKALAQLVIHMDVEQSGHVGRGQQAGVVHMHRRFRERFRDRLSRESAQQRWRSWQRNHLTGPGSQGSIGSASSFGHSNRAPAHSISSSSFSSGPAHGTSTPSGAHTGGSHGPLHNLELNMPPPNLPPKDAEECFSAALYALHVLSFFTLGTISAAFPSFGNTHTTISIQPPQVALWAPPFLRLQEKVDEELRMRSKKGGSYAGMWELDQISSLAKRLLELITSDESLELDDRKEEVKKVVGVFQQHVQELKVDMGSLHTQINGYYSRVVAARTGVLDMMTAVNE